MATKKKVATADKDEEFEELQSRKVTSEADCRVAFEEAAQFQLLASELRAKGAPEALRLAAKFKTPADSLMKKSSVLLTKVMAFALKNRKRLKLDGQRWPISSFGYVQFRKGNPAVTLAEGLTAGDVIVKLRRNAGALRKNHDIDVEELIEKKEILVLERLRTSIPEELREHLGFTVTSMVSAQPVIDFGKINLKQKPARKPTERR
jgi:hypothetical protein